MIRSKIIKNLNLKKIKYLPINISKFFLSLPKILLRLFFNFDTWHISSYAHREYAKAIVKYANQRDSKNSVVEVGCGLGDIIRRLNYEKKMGLDNDRKVLKAAKFISKFFDSSHTDFQEYNFLEPKGLEGVHDVILIINFAHAFNSEILKEKVEEIFKNNLSETGEIILDVIEDKSLKNYKNFHSIEYLTSSLSSDIFKIGEFGSSRCIYSISRNFNKSQG